MSQTACTRTVPAWAQSRSILLQLDGISAKTLGELGGWELNQDVWFYYVGLGF